ncbi:hypothetical protein DICPUDRAFT_99148 [Dictyostelium purpureum]|uniref:Protein-tyrosine-phosphatase n=1 Tax=Dictyostelium purpureum TaxID=5786 RepID=F0ZWP2_DICPU|nr:uncharacterized protein DICPUDRAFT_99148 [Dictyostelium purpureum]EGC31635.1 hypothetical protein DICPUDRAFT_99148 [Dictyostelium purpureum]|eukprot:XP_003291833.1 hypothetical protein DICPUDRAFT_99148 [Dictyostelium purpureum]
MNISMSYRHSTNSVYSLNSHLNIPISTSTTIPSSFLASSSTPEIIPTITTTNTSNTMSSPSTTTTTTDNSGTPNLLKLSSTNAIINNSSSPNLSSTEAMEVDTIGPLNVSSNHARTLAMHNTKSLSTSSINLLNIPPPQLKSSETLNISNSSLPTQAQVQLQQMQQMQQQQIHSLQPQFKKAAISNNSNNNHNNSFSSSLNSLNNSNGINLSNVIDSTPIQTTTSPFSFSSSSLFSNSSSMSNGNGSASTTSTSTSTSASNSMSSSPPSLLTSLSLLDEDKERMRQEFEFIKKPELGTSRKTHKHHQRHYSHNDLDNRKHDEEKFFSALQPNNYGKNRYHDVLPNESTRVRLTPIESGDGDYINANYINGEVPNSYRYYIACQAPLPSTVKDFWRMVWEERSSVIVCLTKLEENGKKKADVYYPETSQQPQEYGSFWVHLHKKVMFKDIGVSSLHLYKKGEEFPREVVLLHYGQWPDCGAPPSSSHIRTLSVMVNTFKQRGNAKSTNGPVIVHCSAGIGRSGTFISININMAKIERYSNDPTQINISIKDSVLELRRQRKGMVQTLDQYIFIYKVINDVLNDMGLRSLASPSKRRSYEIIKPNPMPRLDISTQPPLTFTPKDFQSTISPSTDMVASLSIITQMTQTLKFPQQQNQENPFSKSSIKIPSPLNQNSKTNKQQTQPSKTSFHLEQSHIQPPPLNMSNNGIKLNPFAPTMTSHLFQQNQLNSNSSNSNNNDNNNNNNNNNNEKQLQQKDQCNGFSMLSNNRNNDNNGGPSGGFSNGGGHFVFGSSTSQNNNSNSSNHNGKDSNNSNNKNSGGNTDSDIATTTTNNDSNCESPRAAPIKCF